MLCLVMILPHSASFAIKAESLGEITLSNQAASLPNLSTLKSTFRKMYLNMNRYTSCQSKLSS